MAHSVSARKRVRQNARRREQNAAMRSMFRTQIKRVLRAIHDGDKKSAEEAFRKAGPVIDKIAGKGLIHKNKAARHKSRLVKRIKALD